MPATILPWDELLERKDVLILDTETTGSGERAEIIEIALIDTTGKERFLSLCRPEKPIPIKAMRIHKITDRMVADAKTWPDIHKTVKKLFKQAEYVLAWKAEFDERMLKQTANRYGLQWKNKYKLHDLWQDYRKLRSDRLGHSLEEACGHEGVPRDESKAHRALPDCYDVLEVMRAYVRYES